jgi:hypothetical protein
MERAKINGFEGNCMEELLGGTGITRGGGEIGVGHRTYDY